jgi:hypothetical protein
MVMKVVSNESLDNSSLACDPETFVTIPSLFIRIPEGSPSDVSEMVLIYSQCSGRIYSYHFHPQNSV